MPDIDMADVKAMAARVGVDVHPEARLLQREKPTGDGAAPIVIVDRVDGSTLPDYCVHGYATCVRCDELCWLGSETSKRIVEDGVNPLCLTCIHELIKQGAWPATARPTEHLHDHRRADGPHD